MTTGGNSSSTSCPSCGTKNAEGARYCVQCGTHLSLPEAGEDEGWRGQTIGGRYCLRRKIGRGAMGTVFEAEHVRLHKRVAIKMLHPNLQLDDQSMRRFQQEGVGAGRLRHPGVVQVFAFARA